MKCPLCSCENIDGADTCERCQTDLTTAVDESDGSVIERDLLTRTVGELLAHDYLEVAPDTSVGEVIRRLNDSGHHCAIVVSDGAIRGIFTERDILNKLADSLGQNDGAPVRDFMTPDPVVLDHDVSVAFALNRLVVGGYRHLPIRRDGRLVGMVSVRDVLAYLVERLSETKPIPAA